LGIRYYKKKIQGVYIKQKFQVMHSNPKKNFSRQKKLPKFPKAIIISIPCSPSGVISNLIPTALGNNELSNNFSSKNISVFLSNAGSIFFSVSYFY
jgi:hypothetical protein